MIKFKILILFLIFFTSNTNLFSQKKTFQNLSFSQIENKIDKSHSDSAKMWKLINLYILKSKEEKNYETLIYAYRYSTLYSKYPRNILFADSALQVAEKSGKANLLSSAYINRGKTWMDEKKYQKALDDFLNSIKYSNKTGDDYTTYKSKYYIAQSKIYLGLYADAQQELKFCINYFKENTKTDGLGKDNEMYYMYSLMSYIDTNTKLGKLDANKALLQEAFNYIKANKASKYLPYFTTSEGVNLYSGKKYELSILKFQEALLQFNDQTFHYTINFYLGLSYWQLGNRDEAIKYFKSIDKQYTKSGKLDPQFRPTYEYLIKYYQEAGDKNLTLEYVKKLMNLDRTYEKTYKYLYTTLNKEYDTKKLQQEKDLLENSLQQQRIFYLILILLLILAGGYYLKRFLSLKKIYSEKFQNIMQSEAEKSSYSLKDNEITSVEEPEELYYDNIPGINPQIVEHIVKELEKFEVEKQYLDPHISQKSLSESFGTNSSYLSKIINIYKDKTFIQYINDLRMDYLLNLLKTRRKFLNKDIKELATISGFNSTDSFSKNFKRKFDMKPTQFIKMLKDELKTSGK